MTNAAIYARVSSARHKHDETTCRRPRAEIDKRLEAARTSDPVTNQRTRLQTALAGATSTITRMIELRVEDVDLAAQAARPLPDLPRPAAARRPPTARTTASS